jgi:hypothetical protein
MLPASSAARSISPRCLEFTANQCFPNLSTGWNPNRSTNSDTGITITSWGQGVKKS